MNRLQVLLLLPLLYAELVSSAANGAVCEDGKSSGFFMVDNMMIDAEEAVTLTDTSEEDCLKVCSNNKNSAGRTTSCAAFVYDHKTFTCMLYKDKAEPHGKLAMKAAAGNRYFEKFCLEADLPKSCNDAQFMRADNFVLVGFASNISLADSIEECVAFCARDPACKSSMYFYEEQECITSTESGMTKPEAFHRDDNEKSIYFQNGCFEAPAPKESTEEVPTTTEAPKTTEKAQDEKVEEPKEEAPTSRRRHRPAASLEDTEEDTAEILSTPHASSEGSTASSTEVTSTEVTTTTPESTTTAATSTEPTTASSTTSVEASTSTEATENETLGDDDDSYEDDEYVEELKPSSEIVKSKEPETPSTTEVPEKKKEKTTAAPESEEYEEDEYEEDGAGESSDVSGGHNDGAESEEATEEPTTTPTTTTTTKKPKRSEKQQFHKYKKHPRNFASKTLKANKENLHDINPQKKNEEDFETGVVAAEQEEEEQSAVSKDENKEPVEAETKPKHHKKHRKTKKNKKLAIKKLASEEDEEPTVQEEDANSFFSDWGDWTPCTKGGERQIRRRRCLDLRRCLGALMQVRTCPKSLPVPESPQPVQSVRSIVGVTQVPDDYDDVGFPEAALPIRPPQQSQQPAAEAVQLRQQSNIWSPWQGVCQQFASGQPCNNGEMIGFESRECVASDPAHCEGPFFRYCMLAC